MQGRRVSCCGRRTKAYRPTRRDVHRRNECCPKATIEMHNQQRDAEAPVVSLTEEVEAIRRRVELQRAQSDDTAKRLARLQDQLARKLQSSRNARDE